MIFEIGMIYIFPVLIVIPQIFQSVQVHGPDRTETTWNGTGPSHLKMQQKPYFRAFEIFLWQRVAMKITRGRMECFWHLLGKVVCGGGGGGCSVENSFWVSIWKMRKKFINIFSTQHGKKHSENLFTYILKTKVTKSPRIPPPSPLPLRVVISQTSFSPAA